MSLYYLNGLAANLINASASVLSSTNEDANFPLANLKQNHTWRIFRFNTAATNGTLVVDLGSALPVTFSSVHFHNIGTGITSVQLQSDTVIGFTTPTNRATFTIGQPSFYATFAQGTSERYWRILFNGTPTDKIYIGKWVLGVQTTMAKQQLYDWEVSYMMESVSPQPGIFINRSSQARRMLSLEFIHISLTQLTEGFNINNDSKWGQEPVVIVPDSSGSLNSIIIYGRIKPFWKYSVQEGGIFKHNLDIEEDMFPIIVD